VDESDETNNVLVAPITFNAQLPDLAPVALQAPNTLTSPPYPSVTVVWGVTNQGLGEALGNSGWSDQLYLSSSNNPAGGTHLTSVYEYGPVPPGGRYCSPRSAAVRPTPGELLEGVDGEQQAVPFQQARDREILGHGAFLACW
jgi:hypothetical protein